MVTGILDGLQWLGLSWDEGPAVGGPHQPYFQSQRLAQHREAAQRLLDAGAAYRCFCSAERLRAERERAEARGDAWIYDRTCLSLSPAQAASLQEAGTPSAVRFQVPPGITAFDDQVHGRIEFDRANIEDFVILRSDGDPTYHLSVVVDDIDMAITDVIRGDDHISNTPKHVLLFEALGATAPRFAHVPLILGTDKKRLSKRHGATSVTEYQRQGYLPQTMVNFLALLGWSPGDDRELMTISELVDRFALEGISGGNAVFNPEKLDWMNGQYLATLPIGELASAVRPLLEEAGFGSSSIVRDDSRLHRLLELLRPRAKRLTDFVTQAAPLLRSTVEYEPEAVSKHLGVPDLAAAVRTLVDRLRTTVPFDEPHVEAAVRETATTHGMKAGTLIHATRVAATGRTSSPGLFEILVLLGRDDTVIRLTRLIDFLAVPHSQIS
jgi:glutamyl-tRNA synthetase